MKKIRLLSDCTLLVGVVVMLILYAGGTVWMIFFALTEENVANPSELIPMRIIFGSVYMLMLIAVVASSPRFLCVMTLSETSIIVWIPFRGKKTYSYKQFRNVYCGGYFHGNIAGIGRNIWYIVIAQRKMSNNELDQINQIPNSDEVIKIRYTPKNYKKLKSIFPDSHINQLESAARRIKNG